MLCSFRFVLVIFFSIISITTWCVPIILIVLGGKQSIINNLELLTNQTSESAAVALRRNFQITANNGLSIRNWTLNNGLPFQNEINHRTFLRKSFGEFVSSAPKGSQTHNYRRFMDGSSQAVWRVGDRYSGYQLCQSTGIYNASLSFAEQSPERLFNCTLSQLDRSTSLTMPSNDTAPGTPRSFVNGTIWSTFVAVLNALPIFRTQYYPLGPLYAPNLNEKLVIAMMLAGVKRSAQSASRITLNDIVTGQNEALPSTVFGEEVLHRLLPQDSADEARAFLVDSLGRVVAQSHGDNFFVEQNYSIDSAVYNPQLCFLDVASGGAACMYNVTTHFAYMLLRLVGVRTGQSSQVPAISSTVSDDSYDDGAVFLWSKTTVPFSAPTVSFQLFVFIPEKYYTRGLDAATTNVIVIVCVVACIGVGAIFFGLKMVLSSVEDLTSLLSRDPFDPSLVETFLEAAKDGNVIVAKDNNGGTKNASAKNNEHSDTTSGGQASPKSSSVVRRKRMASKFLFQHHFEEINSLQSAYFDFRMIIENLRSFMPEREKNGGLNSSKMSHSSNDNKISKNTAAANNKSNAKNVENEDNNNKTSASAYKIEDNGMLDGTQEESENIKNQEPEDQENKNSKRKKKNVRFSVSAPASNPNNKNDSNDIDDLMQDGNSSPPSHLQFPTRRHKLQFPRKQKPQQLKAEAFATGDDLHDVNRSKSKNIQGREEESEADECNSSNQSSRSNSSCVSSTTDQNQPVLTLFPGDSFVPPQSPTKSDFPRYLVAVIRIPILTKFSSTFRLSSSSSLSTSSASSSAAASFPQHHRRSSDQPVARSEEDELKTRQKLVELTETIVQTLCHTVLGPIGANLIEYRNDFFIVALRLSRKNLFSKLSQRFIAALIDASSKISSKCADMDGVCPVVRPARRSQPISLVAGLAVGEVRLLRMDCRGASTTPTTAITNATHLDSGDNNNINNLRNDTTGTTATTSAVSIRPLTILSPIVAEAFLTERVASEATCKVDARSSLVNYESTNKLVLPHAIVYAADVLTHRTFGVSSYYLAGDASSCGSAKSANSSMTMVKERIRQDHSKKCYEHEAEAKFYGGDEGDDGGGGVDEDDDDDDDQTPLPFARVITTQRIRNENKIFECEEAAAHALMKQQGE